MTLHLTPRDGPRSVPGALADDDDPRLSIRWDIGPRGAEAALALRNAVTEKAEALLDASGLLIASEGVSIGEGTVATTFVVADFDTARDVVWSGLTEAETAQNCRILGDT